MDLDAYKYDGYTHVITVMMAMQCAVTGSQETDQCLSLATYPSSSTDTMLISRISLSSSLIFYSFPAAAPTLLETIPESRVISVYAVRVRKNCPISGIAVALNA